MSKFEPMKYADWVEVFNSMAAVEESLLKVSRILMLDGKQEGLVEIMSHAVRLTDAVRNQAETIIEWYDQETYSTLFAEKEG